MGTSETMLRKTGFGVAGVGDATKFNFFSHAKKRKKILIRKTIPKEDGTSHVVTSSKHVEASYAIQLAMVFLSRKRQCCEPFWLGLPVPQLEGL